MLRGGFESQNKEDLQEYIYNILLPEKADYNRIESVELVIEKTAKFLSTQVEE